MGNPNVVSGHSEIEKRFDFKKSLIHVISRLALEKYKFGHYGQYLYAIDVNSSEKRLFKEKFEFLLSFQGLDMTENTIKAWTDQHDRVIHVASEQMMLIIEGRVNIYSIYEIYKD